MNSSLFVPVKRRLVTRSGRLPCAICGDMIHGGSVAVCMIVQTQTALELTTDQRWAHQVCADHLEPQLFDDGML